MTSPAAGGSTAQSSLTEQSFRALKWNYIGIAGRTAAQVVAQIALARLLGPESIGVFAVASLIVGFAGLVAELGLGTALIQLQRLDDTHVRYAYTRIAAAGVAGAVTLFVLAEALGGIFDDPRLPLVMQIMAPAVVLWALALVPQALLLRDLASGIIQSIQLASYLVSYVVLGVGLAWLDAGVWSLVVAWYSQALLVLLMYYRHRPHSLRPLWRRDGALDRFGMTIVLTNIANWSIDNVDKLLVGKVFGAGALGLFTVAHNLVRTPANHLVSALQSVLFPASARTQTDPAGLRRGYLTVAAAIALVAFPFFVGAAAMAETVTHALFGAQWAGAAPILCPLALAMAGHCVMAMAGPVLAGKGTPRFELNVQFFVCLVLVAAVIAASRFSLTAVAWAVCAVYALRAVWMTGTVVRELGLSVPDLARALRGGVLLAALVVVTLLVADGVTRALGWTAFQRLALAAPCAGLLCVVALLRFPNIVLSRELAWAARKLAARIPMRGRTVFLKRLGVTGNG